jgi:signal transduction histidine kinase
MSERVKNRFPLFELIMLLALGLIGWAAIGLYQSARKVDGSEKKLGTIRNEYFSVCRFIQTNTTEINDALTAALQSENDPRQNRFERSSEYWYRWLDQKRRIWTQQIRSDADTRAPTYDLAIRKGLLPLLDEIGAAFTNYVRAARYQIRNGRNPALESQITRNHQVALKARTRLWTLGEEARMRGEAMDVTLAAEQEAGNLQIKVRQLRFGLLLTLVITLLIVAVFYRHKAAERAMIIRQQQNRNLEQQTNLDKLSHFGRLAQELAHEIKQPLAAIDARAYTLQKLLPRGTDTQKDAVVIRNEIKRLDRIVKDFLALARPSEPKLVPVHADHTLEEIRDLMASQLEQESITFKVDCEGDLQFLADPQQLKQVLINLIRNAAETLDHGGIITLRSSKTNRLLNGELTETVLLEVADTGPGIDPEIQPLIFDPFFSTKDDGTGLGLAIAAGIVDKHGGTLEFDTTPGKGTVFRIVLPAVTQNHLHEQSLAD